MLLLALMLFCFPGSMMPAQESRGRTTSRAADTPPLDAWIVLQYRGAQLLPDSIGGDRTVATDAPLPRVEHVRDVRGDSLVGVHFASRAAAPALTAGGAARLAVPTGAITELAGRVVARRLFRAPRVPGADTDDSTDWRYGWAYLVVLPRNRDALPAQATRGWLLIDAVPTETRARRRGR